MIDLTRDHKIINRDSFFLLYPVPVVEDKKYLIEVRTHPLAELLQWAIRNRLLLMPEESIYRKGIHSDARTPILAVHADLLRFQIFDQRTNLMPHIDKIESVMSRALVTWAEASPDQESTDLEKLQRLWIAQMNCKTCRSLGILESRFHSHLPPPLARLSTGV
jgi:hypothetical protein